METEAPFRLEKEECTGRATGEMRRLPSSHVSGAPVHLNATCKAASRQFWARSGKEGGGGWHGTPSYASWVTEIKTNLERCLVNRASTPPTQLSPTMLPLPSIHPRSSSPTSFSTISSAHRSNLPSPPQHPHYHHPPTSWTVAAFYSRTSTTHLHQPTSSTSHPNKCFLFWLLLLFQGCGG